MPIAVTDTDALLQCAREHAIDLPIVGPETPLVNGIVDAFQSAGFKIVGRRKYTALLE